MSPAAEPASTPVHLRDHQRAVVDHGTGRLVVTGGPRSGKTVALVARWQRLVGAGPDSASVLVLCRDAVAARAFRRSVLLDHPGQAADVRVVSPWALAFDRLRHDRPDATLIGASQQRAIMRQVLAGCTADVQARLSPHGPTPAVIDELVGLAGVADPNRLPAAVERAAAVGNGDRWEAAAYAIAAYRDQLDADDFVDPAALFEHAAISISTSPPRWSAMLVDDVDLADAWGTPARVIATLVDQVTDVCVAVAPDSEVTAALQAATHLTLAPAPPPAVASTVAVACHHPSVEGEAVASLVANAMAAGAVPDDIVVVARRAGRASAVARALARYGVPVVARADHGQPDPAVLGLIGMLRWVAGDEAGRTALLESPLRPLDAHPDRDASDELKAILDDLRSLAATAHVAVVAHRAFIRLASHLVAEPGPVTDQAGERSLDALVAWLDALNQLADQRPNLTVAELTAESGPGPWDIDPPRLARSRLSGVIEILDPREVRGRSWPVMILCGMVEGEFPRVHAGIRYFDHAHLDDTLLGSSRPPMAAERRARALAHERTLFADLVARATDRVYAVAPREPGVLMSRFVTSWPCQPATLPPVAAPALVPLPPTDNGLPVFPNPALRLSASQLDTFTACPQRYFYEYALHIRGEDNVWATFGTLVHDILEEFVGRDASETDLSRERLVRLADQRWTDDIADYRPQREQARRELFELLEAWWEAEGSQIGSTVEVLAAEREFTITVGPHTVRGRIDRIDRADDGVGVRILDYKTSGKTKPVHELEDDLQLATYHLAALRDPEIAALGAPTQLRLLFLRAMVSREQTVTATHEADTEARILGLADAILAGNFEPSVDAECRHCTVKRLCALWPEGREVPA